jgi:hypothetical protein
MIKASPANAKLALKIKVFGLLFQRLRAGTKGRAGSSCLHAGRNTMMKTLMTMAAAAALLTACGPKTETADKTEGPVVSTSNEPRNTAVDTAPTTGETGPTPGASSYTEGQAKSAIESAGYSAVGPLTQNANGLWQGKATKDGKEVSVSVDYKGAVTAM